MTSASAFSSSLASTSASLPYSQPSNNAHDVNRREFGKLQAEDRMTSRSMTSGSSTSKHCGLLVESTAGGLTRVVKCTLDEDQCLSLQDILASFQTAINEEQAWALCYQSVKCFSQHYQSSQCYLITDPAHLFIHKDGYVHQKSLFPKAAKGGTTNDDKRHLVGTSSHKMFTSLGIVLFHALDYGLCEDEERSLGKPLELLIERLTSAHEIARRRQRKKSRSSNHEANHQDMHSLGSFYDDDHLDDDEVDEEDEDECANADEGIERDCHEDGDSPRSSAQTCQLVDFEHILQMCVSRLSSRESADSHYKAVCRALIAETLELSTFLDQIAKGTKELRKSSTVAIGSSNNSGNESEATLEKLQFHDWARLWIQVIRELRYGVKLKKVDAEDLIHNTEYELTPYEMLLDDIRSRRYKLNKVMINGDLPLRLKKDAHELILDFIRSRPPLVPVSKRVLKPPPPKEVTLYERLMDSIRQEHKLRPTPRPETTFHSLSANTTPLPRHRSMTLTTDDLPAVSSGTNSTSFSSHDRLFKSPSQTAARRKLIKANITLNLPLDDDEADVDEQIQAHHSGRTARPKSAYFASEIASFDEHDASMNGTEGPISEENEVDKDEAKEGSSKEAEDQVDGDDKEHNSKARILQLKRFSTKLFSRERRHSISGLDTKSLKLHNAPSDIIENLNFEEDSRNLVATIWESTELGKSLECLSLTLKEVQHIRSVLTKAEIESLGVTKSLKTDLENGKICFTCLKTRFTFWGPWATICKLCNRSICDRCATKMHIPTDQFERVPIYCLSPSPSPPNEKTTAELFNWPKLDSSCENHKEATSESENEGESKSLPPKMNYSRNRMSRIVRMLTLHNESSTINENSNPKNSGPLVKICRDCKILLRHLIDVGCASIQSGQTSNKQ